MAGGRVDEVRPARRHEPAFPMHGVIAGVIPWIEGEQHDRRSHAHRAARTSPRRAQALRRWLAPRHRHAPGRQLGEACRSSHTLGSSDPSWPADIAPVAVPGAYSGFLVMFPQSPLLPRWGRAAEQSPFPPAASAAFTPRDCGERTRVRARLAAPVVTRGSSRCCCPPEALPAPNGRLADLEQSRCFLVAYAGSVEGRHHTLPQVHRVAHPIAASPCQCLGATDQRKARSRQLGSAVVRAAQLYKKGCDGGVASGCVHLGLLHERGHGVPKDAARAAQLYRKACDAGETTGCSKLGIPWL